MFWITLGLIAGLSAGAWFAWNHGFGGTSPLSGPLGELQQHLAREGLPTRASLVRRGTWEGTREHARFDLEGERDRHFYVVRFATPVLAQRQRDGLLASPSPGHPQVRGELLLYLPGWPADDPATQRVIAAFGRWPVAAAATP